MPVSLPTMTATKTDANPNMEDAKDMTHWECTFVPEDRRMMVVIYSLGSGHNGRKPTVEEVLQSLFLDATAEALTFEEWCAEFGYDDDSRKAERTFKACQKVGRDLKKLLGDDYVAVMNMVKEE